MTADQGPIISAVQEYGDARAADQETADAKTLASLQAEFDAYRAAHPDAPAPAPAPTPSKAPAPLLGMSAPANLWAQRKGEVEATGGKLQARRIFLSSLTASLDPVKAAHAEGLYPVASFKLGSYSWGQVASGAADADLKTLAAALKALGKPVFVCLHHEPAQQSLGAAKGEGGTAAEFAAMQARAAGILKTAGNIDYGVIMNGWMWSAQGRSFSDAELDVWLPPSLRTKLDAIAADDYSPSGGEPSVVKTKNRAAWARRCGDVKALAIGEFNGFKASDLADVVNYAKTEPLFRGGFLCLWNSTGGSYQPLDQTGLLNDFQALLKGW